MWDLWWMKWHWGLFLSEFFQFFPVNIIPPYWPTYHPREEQNAHWWPQFRDVVSPREHEQWFSLCILEADIRCKDRLLFRLALLVVHLTIVTTIIEELLNLYGGVETYGWMLC
jgi:hypothetical protein